MQYDTFEDIFETRCLPGPVPLKRQSADNLHDLENPPTPRDARDDYDKLVRLVAEVLVDGLIVSYSNPRAERIMAQISGTYRSKDFVREVLYGSTSRVEPLIRDLWAVVRPQ